MISFERVTKNKLQYFSSILDKKERLATGLFQIEGIHLFEEFMKSGFQADWIVVHTNFIERHPQLANAIKNKFETITFQANSVEFNKLSDTENSQGIVAGIHKKETSGHSFSSGKKEIIIALDRISDPGNLGTIIRSADWFGIQKIVLGESCVEAYNPKVVRATMGSIFRVSCQVRNLASFIPESHTMHYRSYATTLDPLSGEAVGKIATSSVLVIGNEAHGISEDIKQLCSQEIRIPRYGGAESLNAATACSILMYEFSKQIYGMPT